MGKKRSKNIEVNKVKKNFRRKDYYKLMASFILLVGTVSLFLYIFDGKYTVTFDSNGGSTFSSLRVKKYKEIVLPVPVKAGYSFIGWKDSVGEYVDSNYKVENTTTLKAEYRLKFIVTFVYNNGEENTTQEVLENQMAIAPKEPVKDGYTFDGWYYNDIKYNFDKIVSGNITLEAKWNED